MTTIDYDLPVKDLIDELDATGHVTHIAYKKKSVTLHHNGGRLSHEGVLNVWKTRPASAHFDVDRYGDLAQYVRVQEYAWATGNYVGNQESISIEMCNETVAPTWVVSDTTWTKAARLAGWLFANVVDGRPRPSSANLHYHHYWAATECAGPYMDSIYAKVLVSAQKWYDHFRSVTANLTISTRAVVLAYGGSPMNISDSYYADARQVLAWGRSLPHQPVNPSVEQEWISAVVADNFVHAGSLYRSCITNLQDYFGIGEDSSHILELLLKMKQFGYTIISYDGKVL